MDRLEKVIKGLESLHERLLDAATLDSIAMLDENIVSDALALLKAQEPRVITLEEVKQWCETHPQKQNPIWVEFQHGYGIDGWRVGFINSGLLAWCKYKEARCWTSRPTDEQREAIPWN